MSSRAAKIASVTGCRNAWVAQPDAAREQDREPRHRATYLDFSRGSSVTTQLLENI